MLKGGLYAFRRMLLLSAAALTTMLLPTGASAQPACEAPKATLLVAGLQVLCAGPVGPGGALYVTEGVTGRSLRVDPRTGETTTFASGLPTRVAPIGGAIDVAFIGKTAYALVTLVGPDVGE